MAPSYADDDPGEEHEVPEVEASPGVYILELHMIEAHEAHLTFHGIGGARRLQKAADILFISHDLSLLGCSFLLLAFRSDPFGQACVLNHLFSEL